jgi:hypothetical protein
MVLFPPVINLVLKPSEHHGFIHLLAGINSFNNQMTESIGNIDQAPPRMSPLKSSAKVEGMLREGLFPGQKRSRDKGWWPKAE